MKIKGLYSLFELGGGEATNRYRGVHSKSEKRIIESRYTSIFNQHFENYRYEVPLGKFDKIRVFTLNKVINLLGFLPKIFR